MSDVLSAPDRDLGEGNHLLVDDVDHDLSFAKVKN